ncbi:gas vesicle protein [Streptomyces sp. HUAS MG47]|uniref:gas vesicle protein GvpO n=1 Tax=Streptomyces solicamelliae TaxID=3231716 RepID=UPI003877C064
MKNTENTENTDEREKDDREEREPDNDTENTSEEPDRVPAAEALRNAVQELSQLLGRDPEAVSALKPTDAGWTAKVEFVEIERIPETTSVLASYEVALSPDGQLLGYERGKRYTRAQVDDQNGR